MMPTYEYVCKDCGHEFEVHQASMKNAALLVLLVCPKCQGSVERKFSAPNIIVR